MDDGYLLDFFVQDLVNNNGGSGASEGSRLRAGFEHMAMY